MKRLSSYGVYLLGAVFPFAIIFVVKIFMDYISDPKGNLVIGISMLIVIIGIYLFIIYFFLIKSKRLFYVDSSVYAYNLFSKNFTLINKSKIQFIGRMIYFDPVFWKIIFEDQHGELKSIYFMRNMLNGDFDEIVDELNS
jgi:hypothetical protein